MQHPKPPVPGIDLPTFARWIEQHHPHLGVPSSAELLTGGHSNLTYVVGFGGQDLVLRRPPLGHVMETAHDMAREYRVQKALEATALPVAKMHFHHDDTDGSAGIGSPFYVMEKVAGLPLNCPEDNRRFSPTQLREASFALVRVLAKLHSVDLDSVGLADFGRPEGFLERQVRRWSKQLEASRSRSLPYVEELESLLRPVPQCTSPSLIHGDFKFNNALVRSSGNGVEIAAVLDWEMSTIGDAFVDLALFGLYWQMATLHPVTAEVFESPVDPNSGYPTFQELLEHYCQHRGIDVPDLSWHQAFAAFKTSVITESLYFRHESGGTIGAGFERIGELTEPIAAAGIAFLQSAPRASAGGKTL